MSGLTQSDFSYGIFMVPEMNHRDKESSSPRRRCQRVYRRPGAIRYKCRQGAGRDASHVVQGHQRPVGHIAGDVHPAVQGLWQHAGDVVTYADGL